MDEQPLPFASERGLYLARNGWLRLSIFGSAAQDTETSFPNNRLSHRGIPRFPELHFGHGLQPGLQLKSVDSCGLLCRKNMDLLGGSLNYKRLGGLT